MTNTYQKRPIRFLERYKCMDWVLKIYSVSAKKERVNEEEVSLAKTYLGEWLKNSAAYELETYKIATLILHEGQAANFAIINWWIDENMLQNFVYLRKANEPHYELYSDRGMAACVWELAVWWHERNAWVKHVLMNGAEPDFEAYLQDQLNADF